MKNIHLRIYGSIFFATLLKEIDLEYSIFFKKDNFLEDDSDLKDVIRIIFPEKLKLTEFKRLLQKNSPTIILLNNKNFISQNLHNFVLRTTHAPILSPTWRSHFSSSVPFSSASILSS
jgi:hypothetical protein